MANHKRLATLTLILIAAIAPGLPAETLCPGNVASVALRNVNRYQMIVQVSVNHSGPYDFLLDTGTQVTIIDPALAADLRLSNDGIATIVGVGFHDAAWMAQLKVLEVGTHSVASQRVVVSELQKLRLVDLRIRGILGEDFLEHFDMLIDNAHGLLCLDDSVAMRGTVKGPRVSLASPAPADSVPDAKPLIVSVRFFNGMRPVRLKLDSGSNTPFLYSPSEYLALGVIEGAAWHGRGANGEQQAFMALPVQDMRIGSLGLSKVQFLAPRETRRDSHPVSFDGLLPTGLFRRVFVSHGGEFAVLEPR